LIKKALFSLRTRRLLLTLNCLLLYILLLASLGNYDWYIAPIPMMQNLVTVARVAKPMKELLAGIMILLCINFAWTDYEYWLYLVLCFIPFEFSKAYFTLPKFSPLDYFCTVAVLALVLRRGPFVLWRQALQILGRWDLWLWIGFFAYSLVAAHFMGGTARGPFRWVGFLLLYFLSAEVAMKQPLWPGRLCALLAWLGTGVALDGLYQFWKIPTYVRLVGLFMEHNAFAAYLSLCLPATALYMRLPSRIPVFFRGLMLLISSVAFIMSFSRGAWLGVAAGGLLLADPKWFKGFNTTARRAGGLALLLALFILTLGVVRQRSGRKPLSVSDRKSYLQTGYRIFRAHPWMGLGPGNYSRKIVSYLTEDARRDLQTDVNGRPIGFYFHLHNLYLQMLVELGLIGFMLWAGGFGYLVWRALRKQQSDAVFSIAPILSISIVGFMVHNLVDIVTVNSFDMMFAILLATVTYAIPAPLGKRDG